MAVKIIIDSASDILPSEAQKLGLVFLPLKVIFGEEEYLDSINLTHYEFYEKLVESDVLPTTSQVSPADYIDAYKEVFKDGNTPLVITLSGKLSGTFQSAVIAANDFEETVYLVDSENVSLGERLLILRAVELRNQGMSAREITDILNKEKKSIRLLALLDTLEYLKKGGRISSATAFAGNLLSIKPVISVVEGEVALIGKARGSKQGNNLLRNLVEEGNGIDFTKPYCLAYSGFSDSLLNKYLEDSKELWQNNAKDIPVATVGCTIGTHVGPDTIAVAFFEK